jgi:hypothetical protein
MDPNTLPTACPIESERRSAAGHCPLCNGPVTQLRTETRCARCGFVMCIGCEAVPEVDCDQSA